MPWQGVCVIGGNIAVPQPYRRQPVYEYLLHFLIIKPTRCTNFWNLFCNKTLHVSDSSSVHHQEFFTVHTGMVYVMSETCRVLFQNKFEKLVNLVAFIIRIYHDARSPERLLHFTGWYALICVCVCVYHRQQGSWAVNIRTPYSRDLECQSQPKGLAILTAVSCDIPHFLYTNGGIISVPPNRLRLLAAVFFEIWETSYLLTSHNT